MKEPRKLKLIEKCLIAYGVLTNVKDWKELYELTGRNEGKSKARFEVRASEWKRSHQVQTYIDEVQAMIDDIRQTAVEKYIAEHPSLSSTGFSLINETTGEKYIDYSDPKAQRKKLNELVNTASDSKEALDALKTIMSSQKDDREAAKAQEVQRFYTPLQCRDCPLYQLGEKKVKAFLLNGM